MSVQSNDLIDGERPGLVDRVLRRFRQSPEAQRRPMSIQTTDPELLARLLQGQQAALPQVSPAPQPVPAERVEPKRKRRAASSPIGKALAYVAASVFGLALWALDGYYTLVALQALGVPIEVTLNWPWMLSNAALLAWIIPVLVEAIEQALFGERGILFLVFLVISLINMVGTGYGLWVEFAPELGQGSRTLWALAILGGVVLAFGPGRVIIEAVRALLRLVR